MRHFLQQIYRLQPVHLYEAFLTAGLHASDSTLALDIPTDLQTVASTLAQAIYYNRFTVHLYEAFLTTDLQVAASTPV